jgi:hypothetical protein
MGYEQGCYQFGEMTAAMIGLYCPRCDRLAKFSRAGLVERFGAAHT